MSEERILVVTMGTSLFSSASWKCEGELKSVRGYRGWIEEYLEDPAGRGSEGARTAEDLEKLLREKGTEITSKHFAPDFDRPFRYSGELATLLRFSQSHGEGDESVAAFLRRSYREIQLLAATDVNNSSNVAAKHLQVILRDKLSHPNVTVPGSLRSSHLHELLDHLRKHFEGLARSGAEADLLVTGGYKAYSLLAGKFVATQPDDRRWRALYIHDDKDGHLIVETKEAIEIAGIKETWPHPPWEAR